MSATAPTLGEVLPGTPKAGSIAEIEALAAYANDVMQDGEQFAVSVRGAASQLLGAHSAAVERIQEKLLERLLPGAQVLQQSADEARRALGVYASEVDRIHRQADLVLGDAQRAISSVASAIREVDEIAEAIGVRSPGSWQSVPPGRMPEPILGWRAGGLSGDERDAVTWHLYRLYEDRWLRAASQWCAAVDGLGVAGRRWRSLIDERRAVEGRLVRALEDTPVGHLISLGTSGIGPSTAKRTIALAVSGEAWGKTRLGSPQKARHPLLEKLIDTSDGSGVWDAGIDPKLVAARWDRLSSDEQDALIMEVPWVIGNLPGLDGSVRDRANRLQHEFYREHPELLDLEQLKLLAGIQRILTREEEQVGRGRKAIPPIQLLALSLVDEVPKAAIGYGHVDTATHSSWVVPGMNNDAPDGLYGMDIASMNLFKAQERLARGAGENAVVSWLGYDTPGMPTEGDFSVLGSGKALAGAERLAAEIDGFGAARERGPLGAPVVNVLAHSYGTTVASIALTMLKNPVDAFVMFGSAGLDTDRVKTLDALKVGELSPGQRAIFTTHASRDLLAPGGAGLSGRGQPNPEAKTLLGIHNYSPVYGGALSFSSEGDSAQGLLPTDGHSLIGEGSAPGLIGMSASEGHGYFDPKTQSLKSTAKITMGMVDQTLLASLELTEPVCVTPVVNPVAGLATPLRVECE